LLRLAHGNNPLDRGAAVINHIHCDWDFSAWLLWPDTSTETAIGRQDANCFDLIRVAINFSRIAVVAATFILESALAVVVPGVSNLSIVEAVGES